MELDFPAVKHEGKANVWNHEEADTGDACHRIADLLWFL
jgi:hypothetical protein